MDQVANPPSCLASPSPSPVPLTSIVESALAESAPRGLNSDSALTMRSTVTGLEQMKCNGTQGSCDELVTHSDPSVLGKNVDAPRKYA